MSIIYKYPLTDKVTDLSLPTQHEFLHVNLQGDTTCVWVEIPSDASEAPHTLVSVIVVGTGENFDAEIYSYYIGTYFQGLFVWHVYSNEN